MIYLTGDIHRQGTVSRFEGLTMLHNVKPEDYLIICGDVGCLWYGHPKDDELLAEYDKIPYKILWVDGNHENFDLMKQYPHETWHGGDIQVISKNSYRLCRGQVFNIDGYKIFTFGGGLSIDRYRRVEHESWWADEWPSEEEKETAFKNLEANNWKVDYVVTHAAPREIRNRLIYYSVPLIMKDCKTEDFLEEVYTRLEFKHWFFGHYHKNMNIGDRFTMLYDGYTSINNPQHIEY